MKTIFLGLLIAGGLSGCTSKADRMASCINEGVSRDACYQAEATRQASINNAAMNAAYSNASKAVEQHAQAARVADPLREASFTSPVVSGHINNGFTSATINGKKAQVRRLNANFYEVRGSGYVISIALDANGVQTASWNKTRGRDNGMMQVTQK